MTYEENSPSEKKRRIQNKIGIFLLIAIAAWFALQLGGGDLLKPGTAAPRWSLKSADGSKSALDLEDFRGKVLVLEFLSIGCPHCVREQSQLSELLRKMGSKGVAVVGVMAGGEDLEDIEDYVEERRPGFPIVVDSGAVSAAYKVNSFPTIYIIDREGEVAGGTVGYWKLEDMAEVVAAVLSAD